MTRRNLLGAAAALVPATKINALCQQAGVTGIELKPNCKYVVLFDPRQISAKEIMSLCNWMGEEKMNGIALPVLPDEDGAELESAIQILKFDDNR